MAIGMMQGSTLDIFFTEGSTRSEMKMGTMMNITTITSEKSGDLVMLMSGMIGKNAVKTTLAEMEAKNADKPKMDIQLLDETKNLLGYDCKKAIMTDEDGNESVFWYTDKISMSRKGQSYLNDEIPGVPLQFDMNNNGLKMTMTAGAVETSLDKKAKKEMFDQSIPEGYKVMTIEELSKMGM
jgi:GLPGLI family protein